MTRGRVMWIGAAPSRHPRSGGDLRTQRLLAEIRASMPTFVVGLEGLTRPGAREDVDLLVPAPSRLLVRARSLVGGQPLESARAGGLRRQMDVRRMGRDADLMFVDRLGPSILHPRSARAWMCSLHDVEAARVHDRAAAGFDHPRILALEQAVAADTTCHPVVVSAEDATALGSPRAVVVPNGCDLPATVTRVPSDGGLLFVGAFDHSPNVEAVRWWVEALAPGLPGLALSVVGRAADEFLADLRDHPSVDLVGEVESTAGHLAEAGLVVVPLLSGAGSRLKVVEAWAAGRPVLSTSVGAAGLGARHGVDAWVADSPHEVVDGIRRLMGDLALRQSLADAGRVRAEALTWRVVAEPLVTKMRELLSR